MLFLATTVVVAVLSSKCQYDYNVSANCQLLSVVGLRAYRTLSLGVAGSQEEAFNDQGPSFRLISQREHTHPRQLACFIKFGTRFN